MSITCILPYIYLKSPILTPPQKVTNANAATFPAATGYGMTMAILNLGPCSMLPPHFHPRATNFVVAVSGKTHTYMYTENGAPLIETDLTPGKMTIFPRASLHAMQNTECDNAQLISALNDEDSGTLNLVNGLMGLPDVMLDPAFGYSLPNGFNDTRSDMPPVGTGSIYGDKACLARCRKLGKL
jgi:oxalate decarboxylase/phosphoglucose isomerase-like protein (cupin superfamily)